MSSKTKTIVLTVIGVLAVIFVFKKYPNLPGASFVQRVA